jgi:predicted nucleic acid-binding protein
VIVLDTNVLSALMLQTPDPTVVSWLDEQPAESVWTTSVSVFEIRYGLGILDDGRRKARLETAFQAVLDTELAGRVLDFDQPSADHAATLLAERRRLGRPIEIRDAMIAGIIRARRATLATRNIRHFTETGCSLVDPWANGTR